MNRPTLIHRFTEILLLFLFSIPALSPLFTTIPTRSADGLLHLYRLVELDTLWRTGLFFSRWLPDLAFGYGMPLFNYYAPLVYYLTTPLHLLGIPFTLALNLSLVASMFFGAVGMFYFARALASKLIDDDKRTFITALIAALAYAYSPYLLFNALYRANLAEQWALAFAPFALWRFLVLTERPTARNFTFAVLAFAAVMLSHNVTGFLFAPLLFFFTLVCILAKISRFSVLVSPSQSPISRESFVLRPLSSLLRPPSFVALAAFLLALTLSSFFWLPALLERDFVQIARVIVTPDFDYRFNFVNPFELIALLPRADTGRMNPSFPSTLGMVQVILALLGIILLSVRFRSRRAVPFFALALASIGLIFLMLSFSQPIWDNISLLSFVQLPMRMRGLVALTLAPLIGISLLLLPTRLQTPGAVIAILALLLSAFSLLYPRYATDVPPNPTLSDMFAYEQSSGAFGTTSFGEYLPAWVQNPPDKSPFTDAYAHNAIPNRLILPESVTLCGGDLAPTSLTLCVSSSEPWHAVFQTFFFPGWSATLDDRPLEIMPTPRTGLVSFNVPASGTLRLAYTGTPIENISNGLSIASALLILGILLFVVFQSIRPRDRSPVSSLPSPVSHLGFPANSLNAQRSALPLLILALALIAFKYLYADRPDNIFVTTFNGIHVNDIAVERQAWFGDELYLLGYSVNGGGLGLRTQDYFGKRGETTTITMYWRALPGMHRNLSTYVHLSDSRGKIVAQKDSLHPGNLPTSHWTPDLYIEDTHQLQVPPDLLPGPYDLTIGVYDPQTNERLQTTEGSSEITLPTFIVR